MGVDVEEKGSRRVFGDGGVDVARRTWGTRLLQLEPSSPVGVYGWPEEITSISDLVVVKGHAGLEEEKVPKHAHHSSQD